MFNRFLKWINDYAWYYETGNQGYYILTGDINGYVTVIAEGMREVLKAKTVTEAVVRIEEEIKDEM
jgi:hypothetical protein